LELRSIEKLREQELEEARLLLRGIPGRHSAIPYALFHAATARMRTVSAGMPGPLPLASSTVVNWAKLCLFSIDLSLLLQ
jgi:hypothetical protein